MTYLAKFVLNSAICRWQFSTPGFLQLYHSMRGSTLLLIIVCSILRFCKMYWQPDSGHSHLSPSRSCLHCGLWMWSPHQHHLDHVRIISYLSVIFNITFLLQKFGLHPWSHRTFSRTVHWPFRSLHLAWSTRFGSSTGRPKPRNNGVWMVTAVSVILRLLYYYLFRADRVMSL
jgi:hypothetical protein